MKSPRGQIAVVILVLFLTVLSISAQAGMTISIKGYGPYRQGSGGEFTFVNPVGWDWNPVDNYVDVTTYDGGFQTFCIEHNEYLCKHRTYKVELNSYARNGGPNSDPSAEPGKDNISVGTAWLYENFALGTLPGYHYDVSTNADLSLRKQMAEKLQRAIWYLEDENHAQYNTFTALAYSMFANPKADYTDNRVMVMNLYKQNGAFVQDQLVLGPTVPPPVPAPSALILSAIGVFSAGFMRNKKF